MTVAAIIGDKFHGVFMMFVAIMYLLSCAFIFIIAGAVLASALMVVSGFYNIGYLSCRIINMGKPEQWT